MSAPIYRVLLVEVHPTTGAVSSVAEYRSANVSKIRQVLNDIGEASFSVPMDAPNVALITVLPHDPYQEVQIWRGDECEFWGIVVAATVPPPYNEVQFELRSLEQYFAWRRPGPGAQTELLNNPGFEGSVPPAFPTGWTDMSGVGNVFTLPAAPGFPSLMGTQYMVAGGAAGTDSYVEQVLTISAPANASLRFEVSAWYKSDPPPNDSFGASFNDRGLFLARSTFPGAVLIDTANAPLDPNANDQSWYRLSLDSSVPAGLTYYISIRLYVPNVIVSYDAVAFRRRFATFTVTADRSVLVQRLVDQAANGAAGGGPGGDLASEIVHPPVFIRYASDNPTLGTTVPVYIDHDTAPDFLTLLQDIPRLGLGDFSIRIASGTERTFQLHAVRLGTYRPASTLELGRNIVSVGFGVNSAGVIDQPLINGADWPNTWPDPQPGDRDVWGQVSPTPGSDLQQIEDFRPIEIARRENPCPVSTITVLAASEEARVIDVGDTVPVRIDRGWMQVNQTLRVIARTIYPASETVTFDMGLDA
jgi:hypothetical protein